MSNRLPDGVYQDPETGLFKSGSSNSDLPRRDVVSSSINFGFAAADLTSGVDGQGIDGSDANVIDFDEELDNDEIFALHRLEAVMQIVPQKTATAEHVYRWEYAVRDADDYIASTSEPVTDEAGIASVRRDQTTDDDVHFAGTLAGSGDIVDTVNALGGGADQQHRTHVIEYAGLGLRYPVYDQDDELAVPSFVAVNGSADQGVDFNATVTAIGAVHELD